jgi:hypothetical protein
MAFDYKVKRTEADAKARVDAYVEPRDCFIWFTGNRWGWQSFSETGDTPCAHYVAHQVGLRGSGSVVCAAGYLVRVSDVVSRLGDAIDPKDVCPGDVWARLKGAARSGGGNEPTSHCGMVTAVLRDAAGKVTSVSITHCSSGQRRVAVDDWRRRFGGGGHFYRLPDRERSAETDANLPRLLKGFAFRPPFTPVRTG